MSDPKAVLGKTLALSMGHVSAMHKQLAILNEEHDDADIDRAVIYLEDAFLRMQRALQRCGSEEDA